jgi:FkbH-like protein
MSQQGEQLEQILEEVRREPSYLNLWSAYKKIQTLKIDKRTRKDSLHIGVIGSSTLEPLAACIDVKSRLEGFSTETFVGGFNLYRQEALDSGSELYKSDPSVVILAVDAWSVFDKQFIASFVRVTEAEREATLAHLVSSVSSVVEGLVSNSSALILVNNFVVPVFSPLGIADNKQGIGLHAFFAEANRRLTERFSDSARVFVVDLDTIASDFGKSGIVNWNTWYRGSIPFSEEFTPILAGHYMRYIRALKGKSKKCIVLDLDNTLWGGIIGEDGIDGIKLGNASPGVEFVDFQRYLLSLYNRGVILAICSKNNYDDAIRVLKDHPFQLLKEEHFAAMRINWQNKAVNLVEIAQEINIGLDSIVFLDDNPVERAQISQAYPEVLVVEMPKNPRLYRETIEKLSVFDVLSLTKEDMARGEMYAGKRKREQLEQSATSIEDFLRTLEMKVRVREVTDFDTPRVVQLIGKTNQFNLTTRRYTDAEVGEFRASDKAAVYSMAVSDKFGDEGVVGVAIVRKTDAEWTIDSFLMSCRVIGRSAETAMLAKIAADAREARARRLLGDYIPTKKNPPAADLYEKHGFVKVSTQGDKTTWALDFEHGTVEVPDWIDLNED